MRIKRPAGRGGVENSSALSDLAFLLIIYFIVIAGFNVNRGFLMNLPQKDSVKVVRRDEVLRFSIDGEGRIFLRGQPLSLDQAAREIQSAAAARPNTAVVLTVDGQAPWQKVVSFVELAQKNAVESFSFSMSGAGAPPEGGPAGGRGGEG